MAKKVLNIRSKVVNEDGTPKLPNASDIDFGQIAINYKEGLETISIKNDASGITKFQKQVYVGNGKDASGNTVEIPQITAKIPEIFIDESEESPMVDVYTKSDIDAKVNELKAADETFAAKTSVEALSATTTNNTSRIATIESTYATSAYTEETYAKKADFDKLSGRVDNLEDMVGYGVGAWDVSTASADMLSGTFQGSKEFLLDYDFYLIDVTDNTGTTTTPVGKLKRGNLLRFADGRFAPTIGITSGQAAECDVELFLDKAHQSRYCVAGEFNAEAFYNEHGMAKLYNASGAEVRVLRPWETTETKYTIGIARNKTVYLLDNVIEEANENKKWKGVFSKPTTWRGIDVTDYALPPTAMSPCPITTVGGKARNFLYLYQGEENCQSSKGAGDVFSVFYDQEKTYPRAVDVNQITNMKYVRGLNSTATNPYPFAEGGWHARNEFITSLEVAYGTNNISDANMFGSGINSRDTCNDEATWSRNGGVRIRVKGATDWGYYYFSTTAHPIYYSNSGGKGYNLFDALSYYHPMEACMESQMAASFANEMGVKPGETFNFYGYDYIYENVPNTNGIAALNVILYKVMSGETIGAYNSSGQATTFEVQINMRMSLFNGVNLCGDIWAYGGGGLELVGTCVNAGSGSIGNKVDLYMEPDQTKWLYEESVSAGTGSFGFESKYRHYGQQTTIGGGTVQDYVSYCNWRTTTANSMTEGACYYFWDENYWSTSVGERVRIRVLLRGGAYHSDVSPRHLHATAPVSHAYRYSGGFAQVLIAL